MNTSYERFKQVSDAATALKPTCTFTQLDTLAYTMTDNNSLIS